MPNFSTCRVFLPLCLFLSLAVCAPSPGEDGGSITARINGRAFPSLFEAWAPAESFNDTLTGVVTPIQESAVSTMARHDLIWKGIEAFGVSPPAGVPQGLAQSYTEASIAKARALRAEILKANPQVILLAEIRYYADPEGYLPDNSPWWLRDRNGTRVPDSANGQNPTNYFRLDFHTPELQAQVANLCRLAVQTGVVDGCFLDWWNNTPADRQARLSLAKQLRAVLGDDGLLVVNVNGRMPFAESQPYINGLYMEGFNSRFFPVSDWREAVAAMQLTQSGKLKAPAFTAFEGWSSGNLPDRSSYPLMRMTTTLSLVFSDGYLLYGDPNPLPTPDHLHDLYLPFWSDAAGKRPLGIPLASPTTVARPDGAYQREFANGTVVFNPPDAGNAVTVEFDSVRTSLGTGKHALVFTVAPSDGDIFIR